MGEHDEEATAAFNQNLFDIFTLKDPRSKDVKFVCSEPRAMICSITELCIYYSTPYPLQTPIKYFTEKIITHNLEALPYALDEVERPCGGI